MTARKYAGDILLAGDVAGTLDIAITNNDLSRDATLETAILISLFTDARNTLETDFAEDTRGWWADNTTGSLLWLLERSKSLSQTLAQARDRARTALQWMLDDGLVSALDVTVTAQGNSMFIAIDISKPNGSDVSFVFQYYLNWLAQLQ